MTTEFCVEEREYYLGTFRGRTLVFGVLREEDEPECDEVAREIVDAGANVVLVVPGVADADSPQSLIEIWRALRRSHYARVPGADVRKTAASIAIGGRVHKLVLVDQQMALRDSDGDRRSFVDVGPAGLPAQLVDVARPLYDGVDGINLAEPGGVASELFTYEGSGTLLTLGDYGELRRLGFADYEAAAALLERGAALGFLRQRSRDDVEELLPRAFGFFTAGESPGGVVALEVDKYSGTGLGELEALFTISRFQREGVARRLVDAVHDRARTEGLDGVFAVTTSGRAAAFFRSVGYERVQPVQLPHRKWEGYPRERREAVTCLLYGL